MSVQLKSPHGGAASFTLRQSCSYSATSVITDEHQHIPTHTNKHTRVFHGEHQNSVCPGVRYFAVLSIPDSRRIKNRQKEGKALVKRRAEMNN